MKRALIGNATVEVAFEEDIERIPPRIERDEKNEANNPFDKDCSDAKRECLE